MQNDKNNIDEIINNTFKNIKDIATNNIVVGKTITLTDNIYIIPVSKISVGLISGGFEIFNKKHKNSLNVGSGSGFNIIPVGFICIVDNALNYIAINDGGESKKLIDMIFKMYEYISNNFDLGDNKNEN